MGKEKLQLTGATALLIAAKYEETYPPEIAEICYLSGALVDCIRNIGKKSGAIYVESQVVGFWKEIFKILRCGCSPALASTWVFPCLSSSSAGHALLNQPW